MSLPEIFTESHWKFNAEASRGQQEQVTKSTSDSFSKLFQLVEIGEGGPVSLKRLVNCFQLYQRPWSGL